MQTTNRFLDDFARLTNGMLGVASGLRGELEAMIRVRLQALLADAHLVPRDEFEAMREVAIKARMEQEQLKDRLSGIESRLAALEAAGGPNPGPAYGLGQVSR